MLSCTTALGIILFTASTKSVLSSPKTEPLTSPVPPSTTTFSPPNVIIPPSFVISTPPKLIVLPLRYKSRNLCVMLPISYASLASGIMLPFTVPSRLIALPTLSIIVVLSSANILPTTSPVTLPVTLPVRSPLIEVAVIVSASTVVVSTGPTTLPATPSTITVESSAKTLPTVSCLSAGGPPLINSVPLSVSSILLLLRYIKSLIYTSAHLFSSLPNSRVPSASGIKSAAVLLGSVFCPAYNSSKLLLILVNAVRNGSPSPLLGLLPKLIVCFAIRFSFYTNFKCASSSNNLSSLRLTLIQVNLCFSLLH